MHLNPPIRTEYVAMVVLPRGGTQAVTVKATSRDEALRTLTRQGYQNVLWMLP